MNQTTVDPVGAGAPSLNSEALQHLLGQLVTDVGAAVNGALVILGDRLGIYAALADMGRATSQQLAAKTGLDERQLREWLSAQAASGYITYDGVEATFSLTPEQAAVFADPNSPVAMAGGFYSVSAVYHDEPLVAESFRTGSGYLGESITIVCFAESSGSSDPATKPTSAALGYPHWKASKIN
jgi:hypothetical protein